MHLGWFPIQKACDFGSKRPSITEEYLFDLEKTPILVDETPFLARLASFHPGVCPEIQE
jgi:hypothetical protein